MAVLALREPDTEPPSGANKAHVEEAYTKRHGRPIQMQPSFAWKVPDKYMVL